MYHNNGYLILKYSVPIHDNNVNAWVGSGHTVNRSTFTLP